MRFFLFSRQKLLGINPHPSHQTGPGFVSPLRTSTAPSSSSFVADSGVRVGTAADPGQALLEGVWGLGFGVPVGDGDDHVLTGGSVDAKPVLSPLGKALIRVSACWLSRRFCAVGALMGTDWRLPTISSGLLENDAHACD